MWIKIIGKGYGDVILHIPTVEHMKFTLNQFGNPDFEYLHY